MIPLAAEAEHALRVAGAEQLSYGAKAWLHSRLARWGLLGAAHNLGGLRCSWPHNHDAGDGRCALVATPEGGRRVAVFGSLAEGAAALVASARRAGAPLEGPIDALEGFRSVHVGGASPPEESARRMRLLTAEWEALEGAGAHDERWRAFRDAWRAGAADHGELAEQEERANGARRAFLLAGFSAAAGLSDASHKEFFYLDQRSIRFKNWVFANCGNKRAPDAPPCKLTDSQKKNFSDFLARWIDYAATVNQWAANRGELFGSSVDDDSIRGWRQEFDDWTKILHAAGFEADLPAAAPSPAPKPPPDVPPTPFGDVLAQLKPYALGLAGVVGLFAVASLARSAVSLFGGRS